jgi:NADPH2:quinone reductase
VDDAVIQDGSSKLDSAQAGLRFEAVLQVSTLAVGGSLTTLGYSADRKTTIDVTHLIWKRASIKSSSLFGQPQALWNEAWKVIHSLIDSEAIKPIVAKTFPLAEAADALKYLVEKLPFGKVALTI